MQLLSPCSGNTVGGLVALFVALAWLWDKGCATESTSLFFLVIAGLKRSRKVGDERTSGVQPLSCPSEYNLRVVLMAAESDLTEKKQAKCVCLSMPTSFMVWEYYGAGI